MNDPFETALRERLLARSTVAPRDVEALRTFARSVPARRRVLVPPAFQWLAATAAMVVFAVVALPILTQNWSSGVGSPAPATPTPSAPVIGPAPSPLAPEPTIASPEHAAPTQAPGSAPNMGVIPLDVASGSNVILEVNNVDQPLVRGVTGEAASPGMSVRWFESKVELIDGGSSLRVTWAGYPEDEVVRLTVSETASGGLGLEFTQKAPPPLSDAQGEDRVIVVQLTEKIRAEDVEVTFVAS